MFFALSFLMKAQSYRNKLMLHKTRGIVLNYIKYKDTSIIVKIYTEEFGLQSYIQNGVRSSNAKTNKMSLFQPLIILDMVVYHKNGQEIHRISELKPAYIFQTVHTNFKKITVATFITEVLLKCLKEEIKNPPMFNFIQNSLIIFDHLGSLIFHHQFMLQLSSYLGFHPQSTQEFFMQLEIERFSDKFSNNVIFIEFEKILHSSYEDDIAMDYANRGILLNMIIEYYSLHIEKFGELNSLKILQELAV